MIPVCFTLVLWALAGGSDAALSVSDEWRDVISSTVWVAYSPSTGNPNRGEAAAPSDIRADLGLLREAGFTGLVTYGALPEGTVDIIASLGFRAVIYGVWEPANQAELEAARAVASNSIVIGYCVGNEGLKRRYSLTQLRDAINTLRKNTGKPVTTSEEFDDYTDEKVIRLGDWIFPNAHPYFHGRIEPAAAARWTVGAFDDLRNRSGRFVWFKEVGLPTRGDREGVLSEASQDDYYVRLAQSHVRFAFFEAFDQHWKAPNGVERHWGMFSSEREPKRLGARLLTGGPLPRPSGSDRPRKDGVARDGGETKPPFFVYSDAGSPQNHFQPSSLLGDRGDISVDQAWGLNPKSGDTCIKLRYGAQGIGPNDCSYAPPCKWGALAWRHPPGNKGIDSKWAGRGFDLSGYRRLSFWARADSDCRIKFAVGGLDATYGDSLTYPRSIVAELGREWREFAVNLRGADLHHIITGFSWETNWDTNPDGATFYIDEIRFE